MTRRPPLELTAAAAPATLELTASEAVVDLDRRTITGTLVPPGAGVVGQTSAGPTRFAFGALTWTDPRRVKLLIEHEPASSVGFATQLAWTAERGLVATFHVPQGPAGDVALREADNGVRDGLSVRGRELTAAWASDGVLDVTAGVLAEGSLVAIPAFDDSRVTHVAAARPTTTHDRHEGQRMYTPAQLAALRAAGIDPSNTQAADAHLRELTAGLPVAPPATGVPAGTDVTASALADELLERLRSGGFSPIPPGSPAPGTHAGAAATEVRAGLNLDQFAELASAAARGELANPTELRAALADIVPGDTASVAFVPEYLNELWSGTDYRRKFIENATVQRPLRRGLKMIGHRWVTPPQMDDYAGDKAAVPSNEVELEDVQVTVKRLAGAHDVDRAFVDLGDPGWFASYFEAQTEDYRKKSDARAAAQALADAVALVDNGPDATPATFGTLLEGVVAGAVELATLGEGVEYVAMAPGLIAELFSVTTLEAPAFFGGSFQLNDTGDGVLGGLKFFTTPGITGSQFLMGSRAGTRYHEFGEVPIRVQAVNVANAGVDLGVFGYYATYNRHVNQTRKGTVGA